MKAHEHMINWMVKKEGKPEKKGGRKTHNNNKVR